MTPQQLADLLAKAKAKAASKDYKPNPNPNLVIATTANPTVNPTANPNPTTSINQYGQAITLNPQQQEAANIAMLGKSFCLVGAAGTGKTTTSKAVIAALEQRGIPSLQTSDHKHLVSGTPGIIGCAFTRAAVANLKKNMPSHMANNCITIHALLEYSPVFYEGIDDNGNFYKKRVFEPRRNEQNPLDSSIKVIIIEEASMPSVELFLLLLDALQHSVQFIFIGDINQLPPVMGSAILGYAMLALPVVELTEVYRNAGPIISFAHRILSGVQLKQEDFHTYEVPNTLRIQPWKKKLYSEDAVTLASRAVINLIDAGQFDPTQDMILCPYNKAFGTIEINKYIANHLAKQREETTFEIITGFSVQYFAVGDRVLVNKELGTITSISPNVTYYGKEPQQASKYLDRWGIVNAPKSAEQHLTNHTTDVRDIDAMLDSFTMVVDGDDVKRQASHTIKIALDRYAGLDEEDSIDSNHVELSSAGDVNALLLGYAVTVHKAQGSEWRKLIVLLHHSHNTMINRELLYTAITRARQSLHIICEPTTLVTGIERQAIKGTTLAEKAEFFKGKAVTANLSGLRFN